MDFEKKKKTERGFNLVDIPEIGLLRFIVELIGIRYQAPPLCLCLSPSFLFFPSLSPTGLMTCKCLFYKCIKHFFSKSYYKNCIVWRVSLPCCLSPWAQVHLNIPNQSHVHFYLFIICFVLSETRSHYVVTVLELIM